LKEQTLFKPGSIITNREIHSRGIVIKMTSGKDTVSVILLPSYEVVHWAICKCFQVGGICLTSSL